MAMRAMFAVVGSNVPVAFFEDEIYFTDFFYYFIRN